MSFERKSMEYLVNKMINWAQGVSPKLTDFRIGSKTRTLLESVALALEEQYDKIFRAIRQLIEDNIYAIFSFSKIPVVYATGTVTFARSTPADQNYLITAGTMLMSQATQYNSPIRYYTSADALLAVGTMSVNVGVICDLPGEQGNIPSGTLITFVQKPIGVETVTNPLEFTTGKEEESKENQKTRFQQFRLAQTRGVLQSIQYGATLAKVLDPTTGATLEYVTQALALEDLPTRKGEVDLYICKGVGNATDALKLAVNTILDGYYDTAGNPVYGFKPAGTLVNIYSATIIYATIKTIVTPESYTTLDLMKSLIEAEIAVYFGSLKLGQTVVQSSLEASIKKIKGIYDIKLYLSTDNGVTYNENNITVSQTQIIMPKTPIVYA